MTQDMISGHFEKARSTLKSEHDSMASTVKEEISQSRRKTLSKVL